MDREERKPYQPSNGTEGMHFTDMYCMQCINCDPNPEGEKQCEILMMSMCYYAHEPEYPKEWIYDNEGQPTCTAWVKWDWGNDDDPDGNTPPPKPVPEDPAQLLLPYSIAEIFGDNIISTKHALIEEEVLEQLQMI